jgi:hypothetical protein
MSCLRFARRAFHPACLLVSLCPGCSKRLEACGGGSLHWTRTRWRFRLVQRKRHPAQTTVPSVRPRRSRELRARRATIDSSRAIVPTGPVPAIRPATERSCETCFWRHAGSAAGQTPALAFGQLSTRAAALLRSFDGAVRQTLEELGRGRW